MYKVITTLGAFALASLDLPIAKNDTALRLKEETMSLEYTATADEVVLVMSAESEESLSSIDVRDPKGASVLKMRAAGGRKLALSGYTVESQETSFAEFFGTYSEGLYRIHARTADGRDVKGQALLSYTLPAAPEMVYPLEGAVDVPASGLVIRWKADASAAGYQVVLEQDENDGLSVALPPGTDSFQVPDGVLHPHTKTQVEVAVIGENGNRTLVEIACATR